MSVWQACMFICVCLVAKDVDLTTLMIPIDTVHQRVCYMCSHRRFLLLQ